MQDLEVFKQIPGYRAILKAVLKNQIQSLVQQLAQQTGEESVLLTASLEEGTLTQLGSEFGKVFLEGHDEIKSQFLGFCLKRNQIQKQTKEFQESKPRKSWSSQRKQVSLPRVARRTEPYPVSMTKVITGSTMVMSRSSKVISASVNKNILDIDKRQRKQSQTVKLDENLACANIVSDGPQEPENLTTNIHTAQTNSFGQLGSSLPERQTQAQSFYDSSLTSEAMSTDSSSVLYSERINDENQSTESTLTRNAFQLVSFGSINKEDSTGDEDTEDLEQDDHTSFEEEYNDTREVTGQGHEEQGEGQTRFDVDAVKAEDQTGDSILQNVTSLKGKINSRKSKLRLFNQNKRSTSVQKSLKERKAELENYLNLENTERPYPCNLCPKRFKERHHLVYHLRTHSGHRPYVCTICSKSFTQSSSLNTHKKLHLKDISCELCGQIFRKISLLQSHVCKVLEN